MKGINYIVIRCPSTIGTEVKESISKLLSDYSRAKNKVRHVVKAE